MGTDLTVDVKMTRKLNFLKVDGKKSSASGTLGSGSRDTAQKLEPGA